MKVYLSGKMTGLKPEQIWKNFKKVEKKLSKDPKVEAIMNPAVTYAMEHYEGFSYEDWLKIDYAMIDACDAIALLPNWEDSLGAKREINYAVKHGKIVCFPTRKDYWENNPELATKVAAEVEAYDIKKETEDLFNTLVESAALRKLANETLENA